MSIRVMNWVWEHSGAAGTELLLLLAIADAADDHGRNAYPSVATLARKTRMSERSVQRLVTKLADAGRITVRRGVGGRASNTYSIVLTAQIDNATEDTNNDAEPGPSQPQPDSTDDAVAPGDSGPPDGRNPLSTTGDNLSPRQSDTGDTAMTPQGRHSYDTPGVTQLCRPTRPITVLYPSTEPAPQHEGGTYADVDGGGGEEPRPETGPATSLGPDVDAVLDELARTWPLGPRSRSRLGPAIQTALTAGWTPTALAEHLTANPDGIRNPYAVITTRLSDLPPPPARPDPWPDWCGHCDPASRHQELDDGRVARCRTCHPYAHTA